MKAHKHIANQPVRRVDDEYGWIEYHECECGARRRFVIDQDGNLMDDPGWIEKSDHVFYKRAGGEA